MSLRRALSLSAQLLRSTSNSPLSRGFSATLSAKLDEKAASTPFSDAITDPRLQKKLTFEELRKASDAWCSGLKELGIQQGDTILSVWDDTTSLEFSFVQLGTSKLGAKLAVLNDDAVTPAKVGSALLATEAKVVILPTTLSVASVVPELGGAEWGVPLQSSSFPSLRYVVHNSTSLTKGSQRLRDLLCYQPVEKCTAQAKDVALVEVKVEGDDVKTSALSHEAILKKGFPFPTGLAGVVTS